MFEFDEDRAIVLPPGKPAPPGRLKDPSWAIGGLGTAPIDMAYRWSDVVPAGSVFPKLTKAPMAEAPIGLAEFDLDDPGPIPPGVREDPERAEPPSPSPIRALI